jgi:putative two-component system response regulator
MALMDGYDTSMSRRVEKAAHSHQHASGVIRSQFGKHFAPRVVKAFVDREAEILQIEKHFREAEDASHTMIHAHRW